MPAKIKKHWDMGVNVTIIKSIWRLLCDSLYFLRLFFFYQLVYGPNNIVIWQIENKVKYKISVLNLKN